MKKQLFPLVLLALIGFITCEKQPGRIEMKSDSYTPTSIYRSYAEAHDWAEYSINLLDQTNTKSSKTRELELGICYAVPSTRSVENNGIDTLIYVFNFKNNEGFSIIAANKNTPPLVAVVESGHYVPGEATGVAPFDLMIRRTLDVIESHDSLPELPHHYYDYYELKDSCNARLITKWGQTGVYGKYCSNGISGCVATALGQIMAYKQFPPSIVATVAMGNDYAVGDTIALNWNNINEHIINHPGIVQSCDNVHNQIGALLREIGDLVNMTYGENGSSAYVSNATIALDSFGYTYSQYSDASVSEMKLSIKDGCPVLMRGQTDNLEGHAWVADGYKDFEYWRQVFIAGPFGFYRPGPTVMYASTKLIHINWGWDGVCNGYFAFNSYNTAEGELYDGTSNYASYDFANVVKMIAGITH